METINNVLPTYSVSETVEMIKDVLEDNMMLRRICVRGEISGVYRGTTSFGSPYVTFTMKENGNQLRCAMFQNVQELGFDPADGLSVVCEGMVTIYPGQSQYQLKVSTMRPDGEGAEAAALDALFRRLEEEGLFEQKRPLPKYPKKIAIVTSPTGAAVRDFKDTILPKYPVVEICIIPSLVQGENAVPSLIAGIEQAQNAGADIVIFGRGGGSKEDLACFNSEELARVVYACRVPTISAVGHTRDVSLCDRVADVSVKTPTDAGRVAVPDINTVLRDIDELKKRSQNALNLKLSDLERSVEMLSKDVQLRSPRARIAEWDARLVKLKAMMASRIHRRLENNEHELMRAAQSISDLNPLAVLSRGYSVVSKDGKAVKSAEELTVGDMIDIRLDKGEVTAEVKKT